MSDHSMVTLFVIEDDDVDAMAIERSFRQKRILNTIVRAKDGLEAFAKLESGEIKSPFLILLDLEMPRMNGIEFLVELRKRPEYTKSVIFVLTTSSDQEDIVASYEQHIAGYILKDRTGDDFLQVIELLEGYWKVVHLPES